MGEIYFTTYSKVNKPLNVVPFSRRIVGEFSITIYIPGRYKCGTNFNEYLSKCVNIKQ